LVRRYVHAPGRELVIATMRDADHWCASALARTEVLLALRQMAVHARQQAELWQMAREEWEGFWIVPVDDRCLARAIEIGAQFGQRTVDAIHLAAAHRLPAPLRYLTFDRRQIPAAAALGFDVVSPLVG
jgi:predicted nucleic acid-binding protein